MSLYCQTQATIVIRATGSADLSQCNSQVTGAKYTAHFTALKTESRETKLTAQWPQS